jgi:hypothetical protein
MLVQIFHVIDFKSPQKVLLEDEILSCYFVKGDRLSFLVLLALPEANLKKTEVMKSHYLQTTKFFFHATS